MVSPRKRTKYYYYNRRVLAVGAILVGIFGSVCGGAAAGVKYTERCEYRDGPTDVSAADLVGQTPAGVQYVRVTGLRVAPEFWQGTEGRDHAWVSWLAAAPATDPPPDAQANAPPRRLLLLRIPDVQSGRRMMAVADAGEVTGLVGKADAPPSTVTWYFQRAYPNANVSAALVVREYQAPTIEEVWLLAGLALASLVPLGVGSWYFRWLRRAERPKPPPLPWDRPD